MPKRRSGVSSGGERSTAKRLKSEKNDVETRWEWEGDDSKWTAYSADLSTQLTEAKQKQVELKLDNGVVLKVMFERMVQKNKSTGWDRRVRCCVKDAADSEFYSWEWQDERKTWNPYSAQTVLDLEQARAAGDSTVSVTVSNRKYTIDVTKLEQTNDDTKVIRKVQRLKSEVTETSSSAATIVKSASSGRTTTVAGSVSNGTDKSSQSAAASKSGTSGGSKIKGASKGETSSVKTVLLKGKAPVDAECTSKLGVAHVYSEGKDIYDAMLNQTNVQNNNNKYFILQLLKDDNRNAYNVWFRWGRVGLKGQNNLIACGPDLDDAKKIFCKKFKDKTVNDWENRKKFKKVAGKYDLLQIDYNPKEKNDETENEIEKKEDKKSGKEAEVPDSKLDKRIQALIKLICDVKAMEDMVVEMKYDAKKMPLGKLTTKQIKGGYTALKIIDQCIRNSDFGQKLIQACNDFYTRIPHCFGMQRPPILRSQEEVRAKLQMLEALADIEIAMNIIKKGSSDTNPVDNHYNSIKCALDPLDSSHPDFKMVQTYVTNTHAPTHNQYAMKVLNVFVTNKDGETAAFNDIGNKMLLWHGSRLTNWVGILGQGLRIAPPEAPVTGYMFGKGIYFADMSSKSANYCFATRSKNVGLLLLSEVALGDSNKLLAADDKADRLPPNKQSVTGLGRLAPDPSGNHTMEDGVLVPMGKCKDTGIVNPSGYTLNYNEFIVYDTSQVRMRYLVEVQFNFK